MLNDDPMILVIPKEFLRKKTSTNKIIQHHLEAWMRTWTTITRPQSMSLFMKFRHLMWSRLIVSHRFHQFHHPIMLDSLKKIMSMQTPLLMYPMRQDISSSITTIPTPRIIRIFSGAKATWALSNTISDKLARRTFQASSLDSMIRLSSIKWMTEDLVSSKSTVRLAFRLHALMSICTTMNQSTQEILSKRTLQMDSLTWNSTVIHFGRNQELSCLNVEMFIKPWKCFVSFRNLQS